MTDDAKEQLSIYNPAHKDKIASAVKTVVGVVKSHPGIEKKASILLSYVKVNEEYTKLQFDRVLLHNSKGNGADVEQDLTRTNKKLHDLDIRRGELGAEFYGHTEENIDSNYKRLEAKTEAVLKEQKIDPERSSHESTFNKVVALRLALTEVVEEQLKVEKEKQFKKLLEEDIQKSQKLKEKSQDTDSKKPQVPDEMQEALESFYNKAPDSGDFVQHKVRGNKPPRQGR